MEDNQVKLGKYEHFKGRQYEVIGLAHHSETMEELVVYRALYENKDLWVRPAKMFNDTVEKDGEKMLRFKYLGE